MSCNEPLTNKHLDERASSEKTEYAFVIYGAEQVNIVPHTGSGGCVIVLADGGVLHGDDDCFVANNFK